MKKPSVALLLLVFFFTSGAEADIKATLQAQFDKLTAACSKEDLAAVFVADSEVYPFVSFPPDQRNPVKGTEAIYNKLDSIIKGMGGVRQEIKGTIESVEQLGDKAYIADGPLYIKTKVGDTDKYKRYKANVFWSKRGTQWRIVSVYLY